MKYDEYFGFIPVFSGMHLGTDIKYLVYPDEIIMILIEVTFLLPLGLVE